ncbi:hypothetical protein L2E82_17078 [Cichorium intybus]|uniref:Uncharacterized protein n=1 Tax=Cichorium intybus TaxID=13427 RepID=A0ACB9F799_CICIN|nr:hypothetical protein L2E82_17078 [Cichorium intybus]
MCRILVSYGRISWYGSCRILKEFLKIEAQYAPEPGGVRPGAVRPPLGAVRDKILRISFQGKERRTLVVASLQISRESLRWQERSCDSNLYRQDRISRSHFDGKNGAVSLGNSGITRERDPAKGKDKVRD